MKLLFENWRHYLLEDMDTEQVRKAVLINDEDKVLILRSSDKNEKHAGEWDLPGGHIIEGEDIEDGLLREVWEETSLKIKNPVKLHSNGNDTYYMADLPDTEIKLSDEHTEHKMFSLEDLEDLNLPDKYAKAVKETLS